MLEGVSKAKISFTEVVFFIGLTDASTAWKPRHDRNSCLRGDGCRLHRAETDRCQFRVYG